MAGEQQPTSKQQALMKFALDEVAPVLEQTEKIQSQAKELIDMMAAVRAEIDEDLERLGNIVGVIIQSKENYHKEAQEFTARLDDKMEEIMDTIQTARPLEANKKGSLMSTLIAVILTASVVLSGVYYYYSINLENSVLIGKKIKQEWTNMDKKTQDKINKLLAK